MQPVRRDLLIRVEVAEAVIILQQFIPQAQAGAEAKAPAPAVAADMAVAADGLVAPVRKTAAAMGQTPRARMQAAAPSIMGPIHGQALPTPPIMWE